MTASPKESASGAVHDWLLPAAVLVGVGLVLGGLQRSEPQPLEPLQQGEQVVGMSCGQCHPQVHDAWSTSHHAAAQRFEVAGDTLTLDGRTVRVVGRIGVDPLVQWLVDEGRQRIQVTQLAEHVPSGESFDVFGDDRGVGEWGHWTGGGMTWNRSCASCHGTDVRKGWNGSGYKTTWSDAAVGCAACHGGLAEHAAGAGAPTTATGVDGCAPCHARRAELTDGYAVGAPLLEHFAPALIDGVPGGLFWPDGQVRDEVFEWTTFASSTMHTRGVGCTDCHDAHSGSLVRQGDALCLGCHDALPGFEAHDPHVEGVGCVGCHMPLTTYMQRDPRHDHGFRRPDPVTDVALGVPDACSRCHAERDSVADFVRWYGPHEVDPRAQAFADGDVDGLLAVLADGSPLWRASAAARLAEHARLAKVSEALIRASEDDDPLVRFGAITGLAGDSQAVRAALRDPVRAVRVAAARGMVGQLRLGEPDAEALETYLAHNADQPEALVERGAWALSQGRADLAIADLEAAVRLDPSRVSSLDALAVALSSVGRGAEAVALLEQAAAVAPEDGVLWGRLGLARAQAGDLTGAEVALERAAALHAPRAEYNLGLILAERGAYADAMRALFAAERAEDSAEVRYALASTLWRWGRTDEARIAAKRVLQLDPNHTGALELLRL
jgi:predicted CXXCH cytochrome family protein